MSLKLFNRARRAARTAGFRLGAWHLAFFLAGNLFVLGLAYLLLAASLQKQDRGDILSRMSDLSGEYRTGGLLALYKEIAQTMDTPGNPDWFFVRLIRTDGEVNTVSPLKDPSVYDLSKLGAPALPGETRWDFLPAKGDEVSLEVASVELKDGAVLQVGRDTSDREGFLEHFRSTALAILLPAALLGLLGSVFLTRRALRPLRHLADTVRAIESGKLHSRVRVRGSGDELDELGRLFNLMIDRISLLVSGMHDALDNVAHDLRTPMTRLRAVAETALLPEKTPEARAEALSDCLEESEKVLALLNALMDISEAETGMMKLNPEPSDLSALLREAAEVYGYPAEAKAITILVSAPVPVRLRCDRARVRQSIANLIDNAVKYTRPGGKVHLSARLEGGEAVAEIADTGPGIPAADLPRIWDRLYRGDSSRSEKGLGLGLSLVRAAAKAHGGRAEVSVSAAGSVFTLKLPAAR